METFANNQVKLSLASCTGLSEGKVCAGDGFVDIEPVQVNLMWPPVLATASGKRG